MTCSHIEGVGNNTRSYIGGEVEEEEEEDKEEEPSLCEMSPTAARRNQSKTDSAMSMV
jgi:hypothetical protein